MSEPVTFGQLAASDPTKVFSIEVNEETGAYTVKNSSNTIVATIAAPEQSSVSVSNPFS